MATEVKPYGSWRSPLAAADLAADDVRYGEVGLAGGTLYWVERRPAEGGRAVVVARAGVGVESVPTDLVPLPMNARNRVHEYGGGVYEPSSQGLFFTNDDDAAIYRVSANGDVECVAAIEGVRFADLRFDARRRALVCVAEDHRGDGEPANRLVAVDTGSGELRVLVEDRDFVASPVLRPDGEQIAWIAWSHPDMPWDSAELWLADLDAGGGLRAPRRIAGGDGSAVFQPQWSPSGVLHFVDDPDGWWNLYRWQEGEARRVYGGELEVGLPQWVFRMSTYGFAGEEVIVAGCRRGLWSLARIAPDGTQETVELPFTDIQSVAVEEGRCAFVGASGGQRPAVVVHDLARGGYEVVAGADGALPSGMLSEPRAIEFPTTDEQTAHAFFFPPANGNLCAPDGARPPLIVVSHGGPTAATTAAYDAKIQFWTSRGFAVVDVNYRGSTGYGRAYREALDGRWGVVDVDDCVAAARYLASQGEADAERLIIRGGSAGGYTTLAALAFRDLFSAGASYYGIGDLEALARDTHKFESRYLDRLVGPYPQARSVYVERSPVHAADRIACPVIFFQGLEDRVVPPNQAEAMVAALEANGIPVAYVRFADEQHGFRRAENIVRSLEGELSFYAQVFGFAPADEIEAVAVRGLEA